MPPYENDNNMVGLLGRLVFDDEDDEEVRDVPLPLTGVVVKADVLDFIAEVKLSQCYKNTETWPVEATYHFPVDEAASVCGFEAEYEDGTIVKGVIKEKNQAKAEYKQAVRQGKQANLLETVRRDIFVLNVGNLPPGGYVKITITYVTSLKAQEDAAAFVLPTCIAPRYSPEVDYKTMASDKAMALAPPCSTVKLYGLDINVKFHCRSNIKSITCPTHPSLESSSTYQLEGKTGSVTIMDVTMDRDLVVLATEEKPHQPRACLEVAKDGSMAGLVTIFPQIEFKDMAREFIFLVDRSVSMGGIKIKNARDALLLFLRALPASCAFNIVGFGSSFDTLFHKSMPYNDESLERASTYAMNMSADMGGTEIYAPLKHILGQNISRRVERQVFVLTDGQVSNDSQVFDLIRRNCSKGNNCRLFSLGIGGGVSRHLVEGMARSGRGTARFVEGSNADSLRIKVLGQLKQALQPSLDDVSISWNFPSKPMESSKTPQDTTQLPVKTLLGYRSPDADEKPEPIYPTDTSVRLFPSVPPPVFNKERFLAFALFPDGMKDAPESITIKCDSPDGPLEVTIDIPNEEIFHGSIAHKMAARTAISEYEDTRESHRHYHSVPTSGGIISDAEALKLALRNNLVSDKTSLIAVLETPVVATPNNTANEAAAIQQSLSRTQTALRQELERVSHVRTTIDKDGQLLEKTMDDHKTMNVKQAKKALTALERAQQRERRILMMSIVFFWMAVFYVLWCRVFIRIPFLAVVGALVTWLYRQKKRPFSFIMEEIARIVTPLRPSQTLKNAGTTGKLTRAGAALPPVKTPANVDSPSDRVLKLCLLQKADGAFVLNDNLAHAMGLTPDQMSSLTAAESLHERIWKGSNEKDVFATMLAIAAMRSLFASKKDVWELQEKKALDFVRMHLDGSPDDCIVSLQKSLLKKKRTSI